MEIGNRLTVGMGISVLMPFFRKAQNDPESATSVEDYEEVLEVDEDCGTAPEGDAYDGPGNMRFVIRIV